MNVNAEPHNHELERKAKMIKNLLLACAAVAGGALLALLPNPVRATSFDGVFVVPRVFNDFNSTLSVTNDYPTEVQFDERDLHPFDGGNTFANRHDALFSDDDGATPFAFQIGDSFNVRADVTLEVGSNTPRKEAGIRVNSPITGDVLFIVNSDAGEIVAFGGGAPFFLFGKNADGNGYTPGQTIFMQMIYQPGSDPAVEPGTVEYVINRGEGIETSGPLPFENAENGPLDFNVGIYIQSSPNDPVNDFSLVTFTNIVGNDGETTSQPPLGDVNLDGVVNGLDVDPFVDRLLNGPYQIEPDMNGDGFINGLDVDPFVEAVAGGGGAVVAGPQAVPEPATAALAGAGLLIVAGSYWRRTMAAKGFSR
jgi:hypothetical protein